MGYALISPRWFLNLWDVGLTLNWNFGPLILLLSLWSSPFVGFITVCHWFFQHTDTSKGKGRWSCDEKSQVCLTPLSPPITVATVATSRFSSLNSLVQTSLHICLYLLFSLYLLYLSYLLFYTHPILESGLSNNVRDFCTRIQLAKNPRPFMLLGLMLVSHTSCLISGHCYLAYGPLDWLQPAHFCILLYMFTLMTISWSVFDIIMCTILFDVVSDPCLYWSLPSADGPEFITENSEHYHCYTGLNPTLLTQFRQTDLRHHRAFLCIL